MASPAQRVSSIPVPSAVFQPAVEGVSDEGSTRDEPVQSTEQAGKIIDLKKLEDRCIHIHHHTSHVKEHLASLEAALDEITGEIAAIEEQIATLQASKDQIDEQVRSHRAALKAGASGKSKMTHKHKLDPLIPEQSRLNASIDQLKRELSRLTYERNKSVFQVALHRNLVGDMEAQFESASREWDIANEALQDDLERPEVQAAPPRGD